MSNKNDALQSTRNLIGCTIFLTSEKYRMTNHNPQTKVFTSDKNRIDFPAALTRSFSILHNSWIKIVRTHQPWSNLYIGYFKIKLFI